MVAGVCSDNNQSQLEATTQFRKLLSIGIDLLIWCFFFFFRACNIKKSDCLRLLIMVWIFVERSPPIEEVIQAGVVPRFVEFLQREDYPQLQVSIFDAFLVTFIFCCVFWHIGCFLY